MAKTKQTTNKSGKLKREFYEEEIERLGVELVKIHQYVKPQGLRVVVVFEGRDAAGKGGVIKRIAEGLNPRICRIAALPAPSDRERTQWYFQRYIAQLPAAGEIVLFDRSWYNRAGVERVMGFCTDEEYEEFMRSCPLFEEMLLRSGIKLIKYWFSVSDDEQERRFQAPPRGPGQALEAQPDGPRVALALGRLLAREGRDVRPHGHQALALVGGRGRRQAPRPAQHDHAPAVVSIPYEYVRPRPLTLPPRQSERRLRAPAAQDAALRAGRLLSVVARRVHHLELVPVRIAEEDGVAVRVVVVLAGSLDYLGVLGHEQLVHPIRVRPVVGREGEVMEPRRAIAVRLIP